MLVLAHRGLHAAHPENTLAAFAAALAAGADGCETDVRVAGDGAAVLFHDATSARGHPVAALSRAGLSRDQGYDVPTLEEVLHALPGAFWNLELKEPGALAAIERVMALLAPERLLVSSFIHDTAMACARDLGLPSGLLVAQRPASVRELLSAFAPWPQLRTVVWQDDAVDEDLLGPARSEGWGSWVYGTAAAAQHRRWRAAGVAAIITDYPQMAREA